MNKEELESLFLNAEKFFVEVEDLVYMDDIPYLDAIMMVCDTKDIDPEELVRLKLISPLLKQHLQEEVTLAGQLKPDSTLPF